jgi:FkbM family methyltransferase
VYTAAAAKRYPNARFVAIEPALDALLALRDQIAHNRIDHRVEVVPAAISSSAGISTLSHEASGSWGATLAKPEHAIGTETVATLTLQQVLRGRHPDLIKCNAEGAEFELIPQLEQLPTKPRILIVAVHPGYGDVDSLRETTTRMGYEIRVATDGDHPMWVCVSDG